MTCVIGIRQEHGALIAFDSFSGGNGSLTIPRSDPKGGKLAPWLALGYTFSYRFGQILTHHVTVPEKPKGNSFDWMVTMFVPAVRAALKEHGWLKIENEREEAGQAIIAVGSRIFVVHTDFQIQEPALDYVSVGAGDDVALGALYICNGASAKVNARKALEAAEMFTDSVRPPWHFLTVREP